MATRAIRSFPLAYHITLQAYGAWVPGDPRGWHVRGDGAWARPRPGNEALRAISRELQCDPTVALSGPMAVAVVESIATTARAHAWTLHDAVAIPSHLHVVVTAAALGTFVIDQIRKDSTRELVDRRLHDASRRLWSAGGYFSAIHTTSQLERAVEYVNRHRARAAG